MPIVDTIKGLNEAICKLLRDNIQDPLNRGITWIYIDYPKKKVRFPIISIRQMGLSRTEIGIGDMGSRFEVTYSIQTWNLSTDEAMIDGVRYAASLLRDYLADKIIEVIVNNRAYLKTEYGILDAYIESITTGPYDPETDLYMKEIVVSFLIDKLKS